MGHGAERVANIVSFLLEVLDFFKDPVLLRVLVGYRLFSFFVFLGRLSVNFDFTDTISRNIDVVDPILEFGSHIVSVFVKRFLDDILVIERDAVFHLFALFGLHHSVEVLPSDSKSLDMVNRLVQELRALII